MNLDELSYWFHLIIFFDEVKQFNPTHNATLIDK